MDFYGIFAEYGEVNVIVAIFDSKDKAVDTLVECFGEKRVKYYVTKECTCESRSQDECFGKNIREFMSLTKTEDNPNHIKCSVCGKIKEGKEVKDEEKTYYASIENEDARGYKKIFSHYYGGCGNPDFRVKKVEVNKLKQCSWDLD